MSHSNLKPVFGLAIVSLLALPGCIRRQEEPAAFTKDAPAELEADFAEAEILELDVAAVAEPDRSNSIEVHSQTDASIQWVVKNGANVKKGDELVRLGTSDLEKAVAEITAESLMARAALAKSKAGVTSAKLALFEFVEGLFPLQEEEILVALLEAELQWQLAVENKAPRKLAAAHIKLAQKRLDVHRKFTGPKRNEELEGSISAAKAELEARVGLVQLLLSRRDRMLKQLESCVVKAPASGQAFLADGVRTGLIVRKGQLLIYLQEDK